MIIQEDTYLGDGLYANYDGYQFKLTASNGYPDDDDQVVYLEPRVLETFIEYVRSQDGYEDAFKEIH